MNCIQMLLPEYKLSIATVTPVFQRSEFQNETLPYFPLVGLLLLSQQVTDQVHRVACPSAMFMDNIIIIITSCV